MQRNVHQVCIINISQADMFNNSIRRGLFAVAYPLSRQCEKPTYGISVKRTPTFFSLCRCYELRLTAGRGECIRLVFITMKPIGYLIKEELEKQERSISWFARKLSCDRSNVYRLFQKESIDTNLLARISILLGRDFFAELSDNVKEKL